MSGIYFKFLFATTIKKKPVWITWLLYVLTLTMFIIVMPLAGHVNPYQVWANTTMTVCQTFLGMSVAIFTAVLAINVFKDSNEEGTELIIISKPISRQKIVLTKFILYIVFCLMVNLCAVIISLFTIFIPGTEAEFYWGLVVSMFIGNFVCFSVFGSIAVLLSSQLAKVGVIIANIIISLIFLIYQILTLFVFKTPLKSATDDSVMPVSFVYANRNTQDGSYTEENFVNFNSSLTDEGSFAIKPETWKDVVDYWQDTIKSKDVSKMLNITDLAGQVSLSYLSVGVNKYSERQARRMFGISRFWDYVLISPCSPEFVELEEHSTVKPENQMKLDVVYSGLNHIDYEIYPGIPSFKFYIPANFNFEGLKENTQTSLTGSLDNRVPIASIRGDDLFSNRDVYFEQNKWNKYKDAFEKIYQTVYDWNLVNGRGLPYYDATALNKDIEEDITHTKDESLYGTLWCYTPQNLSKYYDLVWAMLTGHSGEVNFLGDNTPMTQELNESLEINNNIDELNDRLMQYKYYVFYRCLEEQQTLFENPYQFDEELTARNEILNNDWYWHEWQMLGIPLPGIMSELNVRPVDNTWYIEQYTNPDPVLDIGLSFLEKGTRAPNVHLMVQTKDQLKQDLTGADLFNALTTCTYFNYARISSIHDESVYHNENYMYTSLDTPIRKSNFKGIAFTDRQAWTPYIINDALIQQGLDPLPIGHNISYFFYEARQTLNFWIYAVIWIIISFGIFGAGTIIYNKYDVK